MNVHVGLKEINFTTYYGIAASTDSTSTEP